MENLTYPAPVPIAATPPQRGVEVTLIVNQETHIDNINAAAAAVHFLFPNAPVPIRIQRHFYDAATGVTEWLADLDPLTTQRAVAGAHIHVRVNDYEAEIFA